MATSILPNFVGLNFRLPPIDPNLFAISPQVAAQIQNTPQGIALAPTLNSLFGGASNFDGNWALAVGQMVRGIASGQIGVNSGNLLSGLPGLGGNNQFAINYILDRLATKDPDSPDADRMADAMLKIGANTPEAKIQVRNFRIQHIDNTLIQLNQQRLDFIPGSRESQLLELRIQALLARRSNLQFENALGQLLGEEETADIRIRGIRETLKEMDRLQPNDPELIVHVNRLQGLTRGTLIGQQIIQGALQRVRNLAIIDQYNQIAHPPEEKLPPQFAQMFEALGLPAPLPRKREVKKTSPFA